MARTTIADWLKALPISWLVGQTVGKAYWGGVGYVLDDQVDQQIQATKASFPEVAPTDSLPPLSSEYQILKGSGAGTTESATAFGTRLRHSMTSQWPWAGTALGLLIQLYWQGYTSNVYVIQQNGLAYSLSGAPSTTDPTAQLVITNVGTNPTISGTPSWWTFGTDRSLCSQFLVLFTSAPAAWSSIVSPPTTASNPSLGEINNIRSIINTWKPAKATCAGIYVITSGKSIGWPIRLINSGAFSGSTIGPSTVVKFTP